MRVTLGILVALLDRTRPSGPAATISGFGRGRTLACEFPEIDGAPAHLRDVLAATATQSCQAGANMTNAK